MKRTTGIIVTLILIALSTTFALAAEGGNPKKGKYLYKKTCKSCHVAGAEGGELTPLSKTQAQWDRFFEKKGQACQGHAKISEKDVKDVQQFLFDHAADSDQPETCG